MHGNSRLNPDTNLQLNGAWWVGRGLSGLFLFIDYGGVQAVGRGRVCIIKGRGPGAQGILIKGSDGYQE